MSSLALFWSRGPQPDEGRRRLLAAVAANSPTAKPELEATLQLGLAILEMVAWKYEPALAAGLRAKELHEQLGDRRGTAWAASRVGEALLRLKRHDEAARELDLALQTFRELGDTRMTGAVISQQARNLHFQGRSDEAMQLYNEAMPYAKSAADTELLSSIANNLAETEFGKGNVERALDLASNLLPTLAPWDRIGRALTQANIAAYLIQLRRFNEAREMARAAIKDARPAGPVTFAESVQHFAAIAAGEGNWLMAARLFGYCDRAYKELGARLDYTEQTEHDMLFEALKAQIAGDALAAQMAQGATLTDDQAYDEALKV